MTKTLALNELKDTDFKPLINQTFTAIQSDSPSFELLEVSLLGNEPANGERQAFSLLFRSKNTSSPQQSIYQLNHEELGELEIFLVPIGPDQQGMLYEAVFT